MFVSCSYGLRDARQVLCPEPHPCPERSWGRVLVPHSLSHQPTRLYLTAGSTMSPSSARLPYMPCSLLNPHQHSCSYPHTLAPLCQPHSPTSTTRATALVVRRSVEPGQSGGCQVRVAMKPGRSLRIPNHSVTAEPSNETDYRGTAGHKDWSQRCCGPLLPKTAFSASKPQQGSTLVTVQSHSLLRCSSGLHLAPGTTDPTPGDRRMSSHWWNHATA